jgi:hypothetical protein
MIVEWIGIQCGQINIFKEAQDYLIALFGILQ